jgi:hypothetical protein
VAVRFQQWHERWASGNNVPAAYFIVWWQIRLSSERSREHVARRCVRSSIG